MGLRNLRLDIGYCGRGETMLENFLLPALLNANQYDRITSFFTTESLISIATGLDSLWKERGRMRLVLGIHNVPDDLIHAALLNDSEDPASEIINQIRKEIVLGIAKISEELDRNRLSTLAWMMQDNLLEVKVAIPASWKSEGFGIFHNKSFLFKDKDDNIVAAVGSANETGAGLGANFEQLVVFNSWEQPDYVQNQVDFFETLWLDQQEGLSIRELSPEFADEILCALNYPHTDKKPTFQNDTLKVQSLLDIAEKMPALAMLSGSHTALYPHQEATFINALSRWPVRVLLADEVGLGKTFEGGSIISYLLRFGGAKNCLILAPKAVVHQWQAELYEHFGLDAWVYESERNALSSPIGDVRKCSASHHFFEGSNQNIIIMSAQLARGNKQTGHFFSQFTVMPDILLVDEAHAARVKPGLDGSERPTLMWRLLNDIVPKIPHVIFASATPMQVHWREYHALLALLGLPEFWQEPKNYHGSLDLTILNSAPTLQNALLISKLITESISFYRPNLNRLHLNSEERNLLSTLLSKDCPTDISLLTLILGHWQTAQNLMQKVHPAQLLSIRNTRRSLEEIGYRFPHRELPSIALNMNSDVKIFFQQISDYLSEICFSIENTLNPEKHIRAGFVQCGYQQRMASSLTACQLSLKSRKKKVNEIIRELTEHKLTETTPDENDPLFLDWTSDDEESDIQASFAYNVDYSEARQAGRIELQYLDGLINMADRILDDSPDPKISKGIEILIHHLNEGDEVLVFSRYTDTLNALVEAYSTSAKQSFKPYAIYTGENTEINYGYKSERATRNNIREALEDGRIQVVFCSDAASEGLNLQTARVLINIDVPWNPARLEQRIGRIARIGQKAQSVIIYNLWYPNSIESKIYRRLMERSDLYEIAVGEFPDVVSSAIRSEVRARLGDNEDQTDIIEELNKLKNDSQVAALLRLWSKDISPKTLTTKFLKNLSNLAMITAMESGAVIIHDAESIEISDDCSNSKYEISPGGEQVLSIQHPALQWLGRLPINSKAADISVACSNGIPMFFVYKNKIVSPISIPSFLSAICEIPGKNNFAPIEYLNTDSEGNVNCEWLPQPNELAIPVNSEPVPSMRIDFALSKMTLEDIESVICQ